MLCNYRGRLEINLQILIIYLKRLSSTKMRLTKWLEIWRRSITCYREVHRQMKNKREASQKTILRNSNFSHTRKPKKKKMYVQSAWRLQRKVTEYMNSCVNICSIKNASAHGLRNQLSALIVEEIFSRQTICQNWQDRHQALESRERLRQIEDHKDLQIEILQTYRDRKENSAMCSKGNYADYRNSRKSIARCKL